MPTSTISLSSASRATWASSSTASSITPGAPFQRPDWFSGRTWEGHDDLPALDHENPEVLAWATHVARHWLDRGGDGWRFDVAYAIPRPFLRQLTTRVRAVRPDAFLFGEMIHGDYAGIVHDTGLDGVTQYELFKAIWSSLNDANMWELAWALDRHRHFAQSFVPVTFVGNHDVTRIATNLTNPDNLELALAVLFTVPGVPCVYYGDELGWTGSKRKGAGGDDAIRPALPESVPTHIPRSSSTAGGSSSATHDPGSPTHPLRSSARPTASCVSGGCLAAASRVTAARRRRSHGGIGRQSQGAERMDRLAARAATTAGIRGFPAPRLRSAPLPSSPGWSPSSATARAEHQFGAPRAR